jgi:hypothetical protein
MVTWVAGIPVDCSDRLLPEAEAKAGPPFGLHFLVSCGFHTASCLPELYLILLASKNRDLGQHGLLLAPER